MARLARVVYPGLPYHVTHRGNRRPRVFVADGDRDGYVALLATYARKHGVDFQSRGQALRKVDGTRNNGA